MWEVEGKVRESVELVLDLSLSSLHGLLFPVRLSAQRRKGSQKCLSLISSFYLLPSDSSLH